MTNPPDTSTDHPPKLVAILILAFLFLYGIYCLITGRVVPGSAARSISRNERPGLYWWAMICHLIGLIIVGILLFKRAHLL